VIAEVTGLPFAIGEIGDKASDGFEQMALPVP
jgi:hypothetical protein